MTEIPRLKLAACVLLALGATAAGAATKLEAPVKMLMKEHNRVAVLEAVAKTGDSRVTFKVRQTFHGEGDERITVRVDAETYSDVEAGETYVVAFSNIRRNVRFRELREIDPEGYRVLSILGAGPALLQDRPGVRLLFSPAKDGEPPRARLEAALDAIGSDDSRTRSFAVLELRYRPQWYALVQKADANRLRAVLGDSRTETRHYLLETTRELPAAKATWLAEECRQILRTVGPHFDLTTHVPQLALTAIEILEDGGAKADGALVAPFLAANNPGVVKAALQALDHLDPALARARAADVLERDDLHAESRRALREYLGPSG